MEMLSQYGLLALFLSLVVGQDSTLDDLTTDCLQAVLAIEQATIDVAARAQQKLETRLSQLVGELSLDLPPAPPSVDDYLDRGVAYIEKQFESYETYLNRIEQRRRDIEEARGLIDRQEKQVADWLERCSDLAEKIAQARPLLRQLQARIDSGELSPDDVELGAKNRSVSNWIEQLSTLEELLAENEALVEQRSREIEAIREALNQGNLPSAERLDALEESRRATEMLLGVLRLEDARSRSLEASEPGQVLIRFQEAIAIWKNAWSDLEEKRAEALKLVGRLEDAAGDREKLTPPHRDSFDPGDGHRELREARQRLAHAEATLSHLEQRLRLIDDAQEDTDALRDLLTAGVEVIRQVKDATVAVRAAGQVATRLAEEGRIESFAYPDDLPREEIWKRLKSLAVSEARRVRKLDSMASVTDTTEARATAVAEIERQKTEVALARLAYEGELQFVEILEEVRDRSNEELLAELRPGGELAQAIAAARNEASRTLERVNEARSAVRSLIARIQTLDDTYTQLVIDAHEDRSTEIRRELEALANGESKSLLPRDASEDLYRLRGFVGADENATPLEGKIEEDIRIVKVEQRMTRDFLEYMDDLEHLDGELAEERENLAKAVAEHTDQLTRIVELERRRSALAREVQIRIYRAQLPIEQRPTRDENDVGMSSWLQRTEVEKALKARSAFHAQSESLLQRVDRRRAKLTVTLKWKPWAESGDDVAQAEVALIELPIKHSLAAGKTIEDLPDFERERVEYEAEGLMRAERTLSEIVLAPFVDPATRSRYEEPLRAAYQRLQDLDRAKAELTKAEEAYEELIQLNEKWKRELDQGALEVARAIEELRLAQYQESRYHCGIAMAPSKEAELEAAFQEAYQRNLPRLEEELDLRQAVDLLLRSEARLWGVRRWAFSIEHDLSRTGIDNEIIRYRTYIAQISAERDHRDQSAATVRADIAQWRERYQESLRWNALKTFGQIALIPIIAILVLRLTRKVTRRVKNKAQLDPGTDPTVRQRRLQTLTDVVSASFAVLVWSVAGIYILSLLGLDVTPLVASASVAGLAVAFGAQSLVKDFFAGFFILFENQYTVGDVVDLGPAMGTVEQISLRVTVLRDLQGVVHFVPNGLVQTVSNKTKGWSRVVLEVPVSYREDLDRVRHLLTEVLLELGRAEPWSERILDEPEIAGVETLGESTVGIRLMVKTRPGQQWAVARELRERVKKRFDHEGILAPFPQRVVHQVETNPVPVPLDDPD